MIRLLLILRRHLTLLWHLAVGRGNVRVRWALHLGRLRSLRTGTVLCRHSSSFCIGGNFAHLSLESKPYVNGLVMYPSSNTSADCHVLQTTSRTPLDHFQVWTIANSSTLGRSCVRPQTQPLLRPQPSLNGQNPHIARPNSVALPNHSPTQRQPPRRPLTRHILWILKAVSTGLRTPLSRWESPRVESVHDYSQTRIAAHRTAPHRPHSRFAHRAGTSHGSGTTGQPRRGSGTHRSQRLRARHLAPRETGQDLVRLLPDFP